MGTYKVDTDVVSSAVEKLIQLKAKCEEDAAITVPSSGNDSGNMHNKTEELCVEIKNTWKAFITLIDKSIDFLDEDKSTIETQDKTWSKGLQKTGESVSVKVTQIAKNAMGYSYGGLSYRTVGTFENVATKQQYGYNCTSTAWCMGLSILTGKQYDATAWPYWGENGARYIGYKEAFVSHDIWQKSYEEIQSGKPVWFQANNGNQYSGTHAVLIVGVSNNAIDRGALNETSFLVIDPADGIVKNLSEVGYDNYNGACINTYGEDLQ